MLAICQTVDVGGHWVLKRLNDAVSSDSVPKNGGARTHGAWVLFFSISRPTGDCVSGKPPRREAGSPASLRTRPTSRWRRCRLTTAGPLSADEDHQRDPPSHRVRLIAKPFKTKREPLYTNQFIRFPVVS